MSLYEDLGVTPDADADSIKRAYRSKARETHPDKGGKAEEFHKVQKAYEVLSNAASRKEYDETGRTGTEPDIEADARRGVSQMIVSLVDQLEEGVDIKKAALERTASLTHGCESEVVKINRIIRKRGNALKKFKNKASVAASALNLSITLATLELEKVEHNLAVLQRVKEIMESTEYETEPLDLISTFSKFRNAFYNEE